MIMPSFIVAAWNVAVPAITGFFAQKTVQRYLAFGAVAIGLMIFAYHRGSSDRETAYLKQEASKIELALKDYHKEVALQRQAELDRYARDTTLIQDMTREAQRIRAFSNTLTGHINDLAEASSDFELSLGALRLLNDAKAGTPTGGVVPGAAGGTPYADPSPSGLGATDLVRDGVLTAEQYNAARNQCTALQAWVQRELIDANQKRLSPK
jgi:hypothetical protein